MLRLQLANWLEGYANFLELNFWTSSTIKKSSWDDATKTWTIVVNREGEDRILTVKHLVFATGLDARPYVPDIPGRVRQSMMCLTCDRLRWWPMNAGKLQGDRRALDTVHICLQLYL